MYTCDISANFNQTSVISVVVALASWRADNRRTVGGSRDLFGSWFVHTRFVVHPLWYQCHVRDKYRVADTRVVGASSMSRSAAPTIVLHE